MSTENTNIATDTTKQLNDRPALINKIGRTTYRAHIDRITTMSKVRIYQMDF